MQHGRHQSSSRNSSSHTPLSHQMAGALNECYSSSGRPSSYVSASTIKSDNDHQLLASSENAVRHASEAAGLGPVQNSAAAPGSSFNRQASGYYPGTGPHPSAPMGNSASLTHNHNHIRVPQFENATTQYTGHDRTGVGGGRNSNIDAAAGDMMYAGSGGLPRPLPAEHHPHPTTVQPICKQGGIRYAVTTRAYDTPSSLGLTEVVGLS